MKNIIRKFKYAHHPNGYTYDYFVETTEAVYCFKGVFRSMFTSRSMQEYEFITDIFYEEETTF